MRAFTLIEVLIYIGLLGILLTGFVSAAAVIGESSDRISGQALLLDEENFLFQRIRSAAQYATAIQITAETGQSQVLTTSNDSTDTHFYLEHGQLIEMRVDAVDALTNPRITIKHFACALEEGTGPLSLTCALSAALPAGHANVQTASPFLTLYPFTL